jgi:hypothetical protein
MPGAYPQGVSDWCSIWKGSEQKVTNTVAYLCRAAVKKRRKSLVTLAPDKQDDCQRENDKEGCNQSPIAIDFTQRQILKQRIKVHLHMQFH